MFKNDAGELCADAEAVSQRIRTTSTEEVEALEERRGILRDALNALDARLEDLPERERNAALSLLYKEMTEIVFDFHLSLETSESRMKISAAKTHAEKAAAFREFQVDVQELAMLYGLT